jgi:hypothetical protein
MFRTHTSIRDKRTNNLWFTVSLFSSLLPNRTIPAYRQSIKTISTYSSQKRIDDGLSVSRNIREFINDLEFKFDILISRFDLTELSKNKRA